MLTKRKALLYHNLVEDHEATWFWRRLKPLLGYLTLVDFGRLTTLSEMRSVLHDIISGSGVSGGADGLARKAGAGAASSASASAVIIRPLLSCGLAEMHPLGRAASLLLNTLHKGSGDRRIVQYIVEVPAPTASTTSD
jgi:hypothetical protein